MTCLVENTRNQHQWQPVADISSYPQALRSIPLLFAFAGQGGHCGQWHKNLNVVRNPKTHGALCRSTWMAALSSSHSLRRPRTPRTPWQVHCTCFKLPSVSACTWFFGKFWLRGKVWQSRVGVAGVTSFAHVDSSNYPGPSETWTQIMNQRSQCFFVSQILTVHWKEVHQTKKKLSCFLKIQIFQLGIKDHQTIRMYIELGAFGSSASWYFRAKDIALQGFELCKQNDWSAC